MGSAIFASWTLLEKKCVLNEQTLHIDDPKGLDKFHGKRHALPVRIMVGVVYFKKMAW